MNNTNTKIALTNLGMYNEDRLVYKWLNVPFTDEELQETLQQIGVNKQYEEYFISDYETDLSYKISEYENLDELNDLIDRIESLDEWDYNKLCAGLELEGGSLADVLDNLDEFTLFPDVEDEEDLGYYLIDEMGILEIPENLSMYFNYEAYGRDFRINSAGTFTEWGFVYRD